MESYVVDTHALAWFMAEDQRLSSVARQLLLSAEVGEIQIVVSTIVLAELTYIAQRQRVLVTIEQILAQMNQGNGFSIVPFDLAIFQTMLTLPETWDIHDRIIAATAQYYDAVLITRDEVLSGFDRLRTIW